MSESRVLGHDLKGGLSLVFMSLLSISMACAKEHPCTDAEAQRAETETDTLRSWDSLHSWYKRYKQCDDGGIAEGYSEAVARTLVDHWTALPQLRKLAKSDAGFRRFVLGHVDATLNNDDLKKIRANANTQCPSGLGALCADLAKEADDALKYLESLGIK